MAQCKLCGSIHDTEQGVVQHVRMSGQSDSDDPHHKWDDKPEIYRNMEELVSAEDDVEAAAAEQEGNEKGKGTTGDRKESKEDMNSGSGAASVVSEDNGKDNVTVNSGYDFPEGKTDNDNDSSRSKGNGDNREKKKTSKKENILTLDCGHEEVELSQLEEQATEDDLVAGKLPVECDRQDCNEVTWVQ